MPDTFIFAGLTSGEVYTRTQTDDVIKDGDVLVVPKNGVEQHDGIVGFLFGAWPVVVKDNGGWNGGHEFHHATSFLEFLAEYPKYQDSYDTAMSISAFSMPHCETCYRAMPFPVCCCSWCAGKEARNAS